MAPPAKNKKIRKDQVALHQSCHDLVAVASSIITLPYLLVNSEIAMEKSQSDLISTIKIQWIFQPAMLAVVL